MNNLVYCIELLQAAVSDGVATGTTMPVRTLTTTSNRAVYKDRQVCSILPCIWQPLWQVSIIL
jgi:hypothetical protein